MKTWKDIFNNHIVVPSLVPAVRAADANGTGIDLRDYDGNLINVTIGANGITFSGVNKIDLRVEESDDNSTFNAVADADLLGFVTGGVATGTIVVIDANAKANQCYQAGYTGKKRYIRIVADFSGTHGTGTALSATVGLTAAHIKPVR